MMMAASYNLLQTKDLGFYQSPIFIVFIMDTPSFKEDHISQIPALQLLQQFGYAYLTPARAEKVVNAGSANREKEIKN